MILISVTIIIIILLCLPVGYALIYFDAQKLPEMNPVAFISRHAIDHGKRVVVCAGDSLTHGSVSINYVDILSGRPACKDYMFVNAGVNSELAYNLLLRLDTIIKCNPDYITIMIGSNDANRALSNAPAKKHMREMKLPQKPDKNWFKKNLEDICRTLKKETHARIALLSLPIIGEDPENFAFKQVAEYSAVVKEVARLQKVRYLPLNEQMTLQLKGREGRPEIFYKKYSDLPLYRALFKHYILRESYDEISAGYRFMFLTDLLHLNTRGAELVADLIEKFISVF
jgi:lysophospholipase L1-like esterase